MTQLLSNGGGTAQYQQASFAYDSTKALFKILPAMFIWRFDIGTLPMSRVAWCASGVPALKSLTMVENSLSACLISNNTGLMMVSFSTDIGDFTVLNELALPLNEPCAEDSGSEE